MKLADEHRQALEVARRETDRRIGRARAFVREARDALALDDADTVDAQAGFALAETVVRGLRRMSPAERRIMRVKTASAIAELDAIVMTLTDQLAQLAEKLDDLKRYDLAAAAYARWNKMPGQE